MKKLFSLLVLGAAVALASCAKSDLDKKGDGSMVDVTVTANIQSASAMTRTAVKMPDNCQLRYVLEVYKAGTNTQATPRQESFSPTFTVRLVASNNYDFVAWADFVPSGNTDPNEDNAFYYTQAGLKAIAVDYSDFKLNDDSRDAYFHNETMYVTAGFNPSFTLKRPFTQIRVRTTDLKWMSDDSQKPDMVAIDYSNKNTLDANSLKFYTEFNAATGAATVPAATAPTLVAVPIGTAPYPSASDDPTWDGWLSFDYLLADATTNNLVDFDMTFFKGVNPIASKSITNIPLGQNMRVTVYGNLLTVGGTVSLIVDPDFSSDTPQGVTEFARMSDLQSALENPVNPAGSIACLVDDVDIATLKIPNGVTSNQFPTITVYVNDQIDKSGAFTVTGNDYDGKVIFYLMNGKSASSSMDVELSKGSFTLNGAIANLTGTTADHTLVIPVGSTVSGTLTINGGVASVFGSVGAVVVNAPGVVEIYGNAGLVPTGTGKVLWGVSTAVELMTAIEKPAPNAGVAFANNITGDECVILDKDGYILDGKGFTFSGAFTKIDPMEAAKGSNAILIKNNNITVRNLTVTNTDRNGITVYGMTPNPVTGATGVVLENLTLKNNNAAGIVINGATASIEGTYTSSGNAWGGINLGQGGAMNTTPELNIDNATSVDIADATQIWADYATASETSFDAIGWYCSARNISNGASTYVFTNRGTDSGTPAVTQTFTATALNWVNDRYAPAKWENLTSFQGRSSVIHSVVDATTASAARPGGQSSNFYNTQGKRITFNSTLVTDMELSVEIYVSDDMLVAASKPYYVSAWLATSGNSDITPIIAVANALQTDDGRNYTAGAMTPHWMVYSEASSPDAWSIAPVPVTAGWHKVSFTRNAGSDLVDYSIDGTACGSYDMAANGVSALTFDAFILQNYNYTSVAAGAPSVASNWAGYSCDAYFANAQVK